MPWAWDARIEDNPVGSRGLSDFGEAVTLLDPTCVQSAKRTQSRGKHERSSKKPKAALHTPDDGCVDVASCYIQSVQPLATARKTSPQTLAKQARPRHPAARSSPRSSCSAPTPARRKPPPLPRSTSHGTSALLLACIIGIHLVQANCSHHHALHAAARVTAAKPKPSPAQRRSAMRVGASRRRSCTPKSSAAHRVPRRGPQAPHRRGGASCSGR